MKARLGAALAVGALCATVLAALAAVALLLWADWSADERAAALALVQPRAIPLVALLLLVLAAVAIGFAGWLRRLLQAPHRLAEQARIVLGANPAHRLDADPGAGLGAVAGAFNALADQRDALAGQVEQRVREAQARVEEERNRLAALVSELAQGIVACSLDGRILLYNNRARLLFATFAAGGAGAWIGLGRSIHGVLEQPLIDHALHTLKLRLADGRQRAIATFVAASRAGQLLRVQMVPVAAAHGDAALAGYVLLLENVTRKVEAEAERERALHALTEGSRASIANLRAAVETLAGYPDMDAAERERFIGVIAHEVQAMSARLDAQAARQAEALQALSALEEMRGADLLAAARQAIAARVPDVAVSADEAEPQLWVRADSFALIRALAALAARLYDEFGVDAQRLRLRRIERLARLDLAWPARTAGPGALQGWDDQPLGDDEPLGRVSLAEVAARHGGEAWFQRDDDDAELACCRLLLPLADEPDDAAPAGAPAARPAYYDFALLERGTRAHALDERPLAELTYTVFDTETTGLDPLRDEIVQIGAVRIVNRRLLRDECFDQLVDPRRPMRSEAVRVHGITDAMLRGQPTIAEVLPAFHAFCGEDTVLVGHNAAFDMRFLQLKEDSTGVRFAQPLLDTLLLSEVLHPALDAHRLEAIAERLGVPVRSRHHALGDAVATAEVFLRMLDLLHDAGIRTLRQAREAAAKTRYARVRY